MPHDGYLDIRFPYDEVGDWLFVTRATEVISMDTLRPLTDILVRQCLRFYLALSY